MTTMVNPWDSWWKSAYKNGQKHCLPFLDDASKTALLTYWRDFAATLPSKAECLDLACGSGIVMSMMLHTRPDLICKGIDAASQAEGPHKDFTILSGIKMEKLPFADHSFDAILSQFGFEYGDQSATLAEIARVLRPDGAFAFVIHNQIGPVVTHNQRRLSALRWVTQDQALVDRGRNWISDCASSDSAIPHSFVQQVEVAMGQFGKGSAAHEFSLAVFQTLSLVKREGPNAVLSMLDRLETMSSSEIGRLEALVRAAMTTEQLMALVSVLNEKKLNVRGSSTLGGMPDTAALAWTLTGNKVH